jgi:hypothetical protein
MATFPRGQKAPNEIGTDRVGANDWHTNAWPIEAADSYFVAVPVRGFSIPNFAYIVSSSFTTS